jgi:hypothetical protein
MGIIRSAMRVYLALPTITFGSTAQVYQGQPVYFATAHRKALG